MLFKKKRQILRSVAIEPAPSHTQLPESDLSHGRSQAYDCNLKRQNQKIVPIFSHARSNYSHFIVRQLGCDNQNIHVILNSTEKYANFSPQKANAFTF